MGVQRLLRNTPGVESHPFLARLARYADLDVAEVGTIRNAMQGALTIRKKKDIVLEGYICDALHLVDDGFGVRYKLLGNGKRQVLSVILPGDIIGLPGALYRRAVYSVSSVTCMRLNVISLKNFMHLCRDIPSLAFGMLCLSQEDLVMSSDHLIDVGRRTPLERVAHFILELHARLHSIGRASPNSVDVPMSQGIIGDLLGLSAAHVNRMLRQLQEQRLISTCNHTIMIEDATRLRFLAKYEPHVLTGLSLG